jgi:hypothetical protein
MFNEECGMRVTRKQLRRIINEEVKRKSEMSEFGRSRSGKKVRQAGNKIASAASIIHQVSEDQTGMMAETLRKISEFTTKFGESLGSVGSIQEGSSITEGMPTVQELKEVIKAVQRLEKS